jgi:hypothetical protein
MMKRLLAFLFCLFTTAAGAQVCSTTLPYTFVNGTTIDATQVNADLQAIISCVNTNAISATSNLLVPSGTVAFFDLATCPVGWTASGSGATVDIRGRFLRALNNGASIDPANPALGATETSQVGPLTGTISGTAAGQNIAYAVTAGGGGSFSGSTSTVVTDIYAGGGSMASGSGWGITKAGASASGSISVAAEAVNGYTNASSVSGTLACTNCGLETRPQAAALLGCQKN